MSTARLSICRILRKNRARALFRFKRQCVCGALAVAIVAFGLLRAQGEAAPPYDVPEAYEVYSALLPHEWAVTAANAKRLVIRDETVSYKMCLQPDDESARLVGPAIASYEQLNQKHWKFERHFQIDLPYELAGSLHLTGLFKTAGVRDGWKAFYDEYPDSGGWIEFSAVGFNADKTVAVVYQAHHCGGLCGGGSFAVLQKVNGNWQRFRFKGASCAWQS